MELENHLLNIPEVTPEKESRSGDNSVYYDEFDDRHEIDPKVMTFAEKSPNERANFDTHIPNPSAVYTRELAYSQASSQNVEYLKKIVKVQENPFKSKFKPPHKVQSILLPGGGANAKRKVI